MTRILCVGHAVVDYLFRAPTIPTTPAKHHATGFEIVGGGPAANAAVAIARLGGEAMLATRLGDDAAGDQIVADLTREGVDCSLVQRFPGARSSASAVLVDDAGERMIVNYLDPSLPDDPAWLLDRWPEGPDAVLADSCWHGGARSALQRARAAGSPAVLDAEHHAPNDPDFFAAASHVAFSAEGLRHLTGTDDIAAALDDAARRIDRWSCVTDGARGVRIATPTDREVIRTPKVDAVDTLAAGDIWHGAFVLALAEGADERAAVNFANAAAAIKVTRPGGRKGAPTRAETARFLEARKQEAPSCI